MYQPSQTGNKQTFICAPDICLCQGDGESARNKNNLCWYQDDLTCCIVLSASTLVVTQLRLGTSVQVWSKKSETRGSPGSSERREALFFSVERTGSAGADFKYNWHDFDFITRETVPDPEAWIASQRLISVVNRMQLGGGPWDFPSPAYSVCRSVHIWSSERGGLA